MFSLFPEGADHGRATAGSDYLAKSGTIMFLPGEMVQTITILIKGDSNVETDESFLINLLDPTHTILVDAIAKAIILNND